MNMRRYGIGRPWLAMAAENFTRCKTRLGMLWSQRRIEVEGGVRLASTVRVRGEGRVVIRAGASIGASTTLVVERDALLEVGPQVRIGERVQLNARRGQEMHLGAEACIEEDVQIVSVAGTRIGRGAVVGARTAIVCREANGSGRFTLGDRSHLSIDNLVDICGDVVLGEDVRTGPNCSIYTHQHTPSEKALIWDQPVVIKPVRVGDAVWIGHGCQLMPGVEIGDASVVGAGAVVTKSVAAATVAAGIPARQLAAIET